MINIETIWSTQNDLRSIPRLRDLLRSMYTPDPYFCRGVKLARINDRLYVMDGHHRLTALILSEVTQLPEPYYIREFRERDFMHANLEAGWVTPHDPSQYVRKADLYPWKSALLQIPEDQQWQYIQDNFDSYAERREVYTMRDLATRCARKV